MANETKFSFKMIEKGVQRRARKIIIYGPPKIGKSTLAGSTAKALLIPTEDRVAHIDCAKTPVIESYEQLIEILDWLLSKENIIGGKRTFNRVIIDTLDWLEPKIHDYACRAEGLKSLNDDSVKEVNYGRGMRIVAVKYWKQLLAKLDTLRLEGIDVIIVSHAQTIKVNLPNVDEYDKFVMKIDKNALSIFEEWADVIAFYSNEVRVKKGEGLNKDKGKAISLNRRKVYVQGDSAAMIAGNSFGLINFDVDVNECTQIMEYLLTGNGDGIPEEEE